MNDIQTIQVNEETTAEIYPTHAVMLKQGNNTIAITMEGLLKIFLASKDKDSPEPPPLRIIIEENSN